MKWITKLTDDELIELYKSFMGKDDKFVDLTITRDESDITS